MFNISKEGWKHWIEMVNYPAPEPEPHARDDDLGFHEDDKLPLIFEDRVIYQERVDGCKVDLLLDLLGSCHPP